QTAYRYRMSYRAMTPEQRCDAILDFHESHDPERQLEAELHAHALIRDAELLGEDARAHALHVFDWIDSIYENDDDESGEDEVLLPLQEGAALVYLGRL